MVSVSATVAGRICSRWAALGVLTTGEELTLKDDWVAKNARRSNLPEYKRQLSRIDRQFGALLKQLPNRSEIESLLADINQAGLGRGLQFELFKPGS